MAEPEFEATGVRIRRWLRSLTRAGQVLVRDDRLALLTSYGREIDSAVVGEARLRGPLPLSRNLSLLSLAGRRYAVRLAAPERERLLRTLLEAREREAARRRAAAPQAPAPRERPARLASEQRAVSP